MGSKTNEVSAFEAKTRLSELLRETERGRSFVIRRRGKAVAQLVPPVKEERIPDLGQLLASFREIRKRIPQTLNVSELIEEGRRLSGLISAQGAGACYTGPASHYGSAEGRGCGHSPIDFA